MFQYVTFHCVTMNVLHFIVLHFIMFTFKWPYTVEMNVNMLHQINDFKKVFFFYLPITSTMVKFLNKKYFAVILLHHQNMKKMTHHYIKEALPFQVQLSVTCTSSYQIHVQPIKYQPLSSIRQWFISQYALLYKIKHTQRAQTCFPRSVRTKHSFFRNR